jgi:hypothetical protein
MIQRYISDSHGERASINEVTASSGILQVGVYDKNDCNDETGGRNKNLNSVITGIATTGGFKAMITIGIIGGFIAMRILISFHRIGV